VLINYSCILKDAIESEAGSSGMLDDETQERREGKLGSDAEGLSAAVRSWIDLTTGVVMV
jgi:hypothetical protein